MSGVSKDAKIIRRDDADFFIRTGMCVVGRTAFDIERGIAVHSAHRQNDSETRVRDAGEIRNAPLDFAEKVYERFLVGIFHDRQRHLHRQHILRIESRIYILQTDEALDQKPGAGKKDKRERDFRYD